MIDPSAHIHEKAHTDDTVSIGARSRIWQFASIIRGAKIGVDCSVASGSCIDGARVGDRCVIAHNLAMGPGFLIGDDVFIGPNVTFCNDAWPRANKSGFDASRFNSFDWAVIVENGASIGAGAVILPGVRIGARAMIAANAVVSRDVDPDTLYISKDESREIDHDKARMRFADKYRALEQEAAAYDHQLGIG